MKRALLGWLLLGSALSAQPLTPGQPLRRTQNMLPQTAAMREARFLFEEGRRLHRQGQLGRALDLYQKSLAQDPGRIEYLPFLGQVLNQLGRFEEALPAFQSYLKLEPTDRPVRLGLLECLIGLQRWPEVDALAAQLAAVSLTGDDADYRHLVGLSWLRRNQPEQALPHLLAASPSRLDYRLNAAVALLLLGRTAEADQQLQPQPEAASAHWKLLKGVVELRSGHAEAAEALWREVDLPEATLNLATSLAQRGHDLEARTLVARLLDRNSQHPEARLLYARLLNRQNRFEEALPLLAPLALSAYREELRGWALLGSGRASEALEALQQASTLGASGAALEHNLALAHAQLKQWKPAGQHLQQALNMQPEWADLYYLQGKLCEQQQQISQAIQAYQRYLELLPQAPEAELLKAHLKKLKNSI